MSKFGRSFVENVYFKRGVSPTFSTISENKVLKYLNSLGCSKPPSLDGLEVIWLRTICCTNFSLGSEVAFRQTYVYYIFQTILDLDHQILFKDRVLLLSMDNRPIKFKGLVQMVLQFFSGNSFPSSCPCDLDLCPYYTKQNRFLLLHKGNYPIVFEGCGWNVIPDFEQKRFSL